MNDQQKLQKQILFFKYFWKFSTHRGRILVKERLPVETLEEGFCIHPPYLFYYLQDSNFISARKYLHTESAQRAV